MTGLILDLIVVALILLLVLFGLWRGAYKLLFGLISSLLALILSVVLVSSVTQLVVSKTTIDDRIAIAIDAPITSKIPNSGAAIKYYDIDGDGKAEELGYMVEGEVFAFDTILKGTPYSILSRPIEGVIGKQIAKDGEVVFATALVGTLVSYIMLAICFVVLLILMMIIVKLIMRLIRKFVTKTFFGHFVDKFLGAILGIVIAGVIIYGSLAIIKLLGTYQFIIPINNVIEDSTITKFFFEKNFLYNLLVKSFNIKGIIDGIIAKVSTLGGKLPKPATPVA